MAQGFTKLLRFFCRCGRLSGTQGGRRAVKKYPEPYFRADRNQYYFMHRDSSGKRYRRATGLGKGKKDEARAYIREYIDGLDYTKRTFREYAEPFYTVRCPINAERSVDNKAFTQKYLKNMHQVLESYVYNDAFSNIPIAEISRGDVRQLKVRLYERCPGYATANRALVAVKSILTYAEGNEHIERNPGARVTPVTNYDKQDAPRRITVDETNQIIAGLSDFDHRMYTILALTGCRVSELLAMHREDIDGDTWHICRAWKPDGTLGPTKTRYTRRIKLCQRAEEAVTEQLATHPHALVFCYADGSRIGYRYALTHFTAAAKGLPGKVLPKSLRLSLNSNLLVAGAIPTLLQDYQGWRKTGLTRVQEEHYTRLYVDDSASIASLIDRVYGQKTKKIEKNA